MRTSLSSLCSCYRRQILFYATPTATTTATLAGTTSTRAASPTATATLATSATSAAFHAATTTASGLPLHRCLCRYLNGHSTLQHNLDRVGGDVNRDNLTRAAWCIQNGTKRWHLLLGLDVVVIFIGEAAEQASTHTRDFRGVERQSLLFRHLDRDNAEFSDPGTTAQCFATNAHASL